MASPSGEEVSVTEMEDDNHHHSHLHDEHDEDDGMGDDEEKDEQDEEHEEVEDVSNNEHDGENQQSKGGSPKNKKLVSNDESRKFFPRLKALLSPEYEEFLQGVLHILAKHHCAAYPTANPNNAWQYAFEDLYEGIAKEYSKPWGKNRLHKFKDKMVEIWVAMDEAVGSGRMSAAHPLYARARQQLETYQTVVGGRKSGLALEAKLQENHGASDGPRKKKALKPDPGHGTGGEQRVHKSPAPPPAAVAGPSGIGGVYGGVVPPAVAMNPFAPGGSAGVPPYGAPHHMYITSTITTELQKQQKVFMGMWQNSLTRLESHVSTAASQWAPPKLPSPLHELHRMKLNYQAYAGQTISKIKSGEELDEETTEEGLWVERHYTDALGKYLQQVTEQAESSAHPTMLPSILEGLQVLRLADQEPTTMKSIQFAYKKVLGRYLQLTNPAVAADGAGRTKKKRDSTAIAAGQNSAGKKQRGSKMQAPHASVPASEAQTPTLEHANSDEIFKEGV